MCKIFSDFNAFMDFIFAFIIMITSLILVIISPENINEIFKDLCICTLGISSLATIYTGWKLYKSIPK